MKNNCQIFLSNIEYIKKNNNLNSNITYDYNEELIKNRELIIDDFSFCVNFYKCKFPKKIVSVNQIKNSDMFEDKFITSVSISNNDFLINDLLYIMFDSKKKAEVDFNDKVNLLTSINNSEKIFEYLNNNIDFTKF